MQRRSSREAWRGTYRQGRHRRPELPEQLGVNDAGKHGECYHAGDDNRRVIQGMV